MYRKFPSVMNPLKYGYSFDQGNFNHTNEVCRRFQQFETYGDGLIQHSHAWPVTLDFMADYLASLATFLVANPEEPGPEETFINSLAYEFSDGPSVQAIEFAASVVFREFDRSWDKRRYYSVSERKMGGKTKEHDKRYEEIKEWNDGSPAAIFRMLLPEYSTALTRYCYAAKLLEWVDTQPKLYMTRDLAEFLEWKQYTGRYDSVECQRGEILRASFQVITEIIRRYRLSDMINRSKEHLDRLIVEAAKPKNEQTDAA